MTRAQRRAHATIVSLLAAFLTSALVYALVRRHVVASAESASIGRVLVHDAARTP